jgi:hypothetical protein
METIIGGAIAGIIGLSIVFIQKYLNEKREQSIIVRELLTEVKENIRINTDPAIRTLWWTVKYKTEVYNKHKGKLGFLSEEIRNHLAEIAYLVEPINSSVDVHRLSSALKTHGSPSAFLPIPAFPPLQTSLQLCQGELERWQIKHGSKIGVSKMMEKLRPGSSIAFMLLGIPVVILSKGDIGLLAIGITISGLGLTTLIAYRASKETETKIEKFRNEVISEIRDLKKAIGRHFQSSKKS